jgi:cytochrome P450
VISPPISPTRLVDPELHAAGAADDVWRWMRMHAPIYRHAVTDSLSGFWSLTRHADIRAVYSAPQLFSSSEGVLLRPIKAGADPGKGLTLALTDPPRHRQIRTLLADWFTEGAARSMQPALSGKIKVLLATAFQQDQVEFVHDVAVPFTIHVICSILGVPSEAHEEVTSWADEAFASSKSLAAHRGFMMYFATLIERRLAQPGPDLVSALVHERVDGELLSEREILLNCENIVGATENAALSMAGAVQAFIDHPDQWRRLQQDPALLSTAVEEVLRWTSSATHSMRTVTAPTRIRDQRIDAGERVVLWIPSANRDSDVFAEPYRFDIARRPNLHISLGHGEHFCIGNAFARSQLRILLSELLALKHRIEPIEGSAMLRSIAVNGYAKLPVRFVPE